MATKASTPVATTSFTGRKRVRKTFGKIHEVVQMPNLIEVQRESYEHFLRSRPADGYVSGLEKTLRSVFPIRDFAGTSELDFVHYELEEPKYDTEECRQRGMTYAAPMRVTLRLIVFEVDAETEARSVLDIKEQDVYMGDMPLMTGNGTFIINGTERVIVSQMHRSPGVFFDHDRGKTHASGKFLFAARVIPYRGSWLDFEFDAKDIVNVRIDRKRKLPVTSLLYTLGDTVFQIDDVVNAPAVGETVRIAGHFPAKVEEFDGKYLRVSGLHGAVSDGQYITRDGERDKDVGVIKRVVSRGMNSEQILNEFYGRVTWVRGQGGWIVPFEAEQWRGTKPSFDVVNAETGEVAFPLGTKITPRLARKAQTDGLKAADPDRGNLRPLFGL
jgi:DNA-directed RNA polymerase subunit beta